jgi:hypothetical protein
MPNRSIASGDYRFGYNKGSEKDDEISGNGNHFTTFYREGDTRLATWWGVDPKTNEQPWQTSYSFMDGNPIWHNDEKGDIVDGDEKGKKGYKEAYDGVKNKINELSKQIDEKLSQWKEKGYSSKSIEKTISNLNEKRSGLINIKESFEAVENSKEVFYYIGEANSENHISGGNTRYNIGKKRFDIKFFEGNLWTIIHETRHGAGVVFKEWGIKLDPKEKDGYKLSNYDYQDEYEGYLNENRYLLNILNTSPRSIRMGGIKDVIENNYNTDPNIIKSYSQHCDE